MIEHVKNMLLFLLSIFKIMYRLYLLKKHDQNKEWQ